MATRVPRTPKARKTKVSVIIPARNEEEYIERCIESIKDQDFKNYEIIVVDNGSTDNTRLIAESLRAKVVFEPITGLPRAREAGRREAKGELLVYLDADTIVPPHYLSKIVDTFDRHPEISAVSNPFSFYDGGFMLSVMGAILFNICKIFCKLNIVKGVFGGNFTVRKEIIEKIGGFDSNIEFYGEDANISKRILESGKIAFIENLYTMTSARRYNREGIIKTSFIYLTNYISMRYFHQVFRFPKFQVPLLLRYAGMCLPVIALLVYGFAYPSSTLLGKIMYKVDCGKDKVVALTFDDGPNGKYTEQILDILDREGIKATFFLIGENAEFYPHLTKEIVQRGHTIGNHSYSHPWKLPFEHKRAILNEISKTDSIIYNIAGMHTSLFRPPHGIRTPWMMDIVKNDGYEIVTWDDMTIDYMSKVKAETVAKNILRIIEPGSIIVLHDGVNLKHGTNRDNSIKALPIIIEELKKEGYKFVTLHSLPQQV